MMVREAGESLIELKHFQPALEYFLKAFALDNLSVFNEKRGGGDKKKKKNSDDSATALWNGEQEGYCGCPHLIGKEPQYLPSPSIIKAVTAVEKPAPALKHDWHSFDEADGQLQGSRLLGRHWPERESDWRGGGGGSEKDGQETRQSC